MVVLNIISDRMGLLTQKWVVLVFFPAILAVTIGYFVFSSSSTSNKDGKTPPSIPELLPGITNAYHFIFNNMYFIKNAVSHLNGHTILKFSLGPKGVYLVTGPKNVQAVLRSSGHLSSDELFLMALRQLDDVQAVDVDRFRNDKTGRSPVPAVPVREGVDRVWADNHQIFAEYMTRPDAIRAMVTKYTEVFAEKLEKRPKGVWQSLQLYQFLQREVVEASIIAFSGRLILQMNPGFIDALWELDKTVFPLVMGVPKIFYRKGYAARDRYLDMAERFLKEAHAKFDWDGPDADAEWEEIFGSRFHRKHSKYLKDKGFKSRSRAGMHVGTNWALNANAVPIMSWAMIEILKDKSLLAAVRAEAETAVQPVAHSGIRTMDMAKLIELPLIQSIYVEALRVHTAINLTREVMQDMTLGGYKLKKGYLVQAPNIIPHFDESTWGTEGHPASEFWAERHIVYVNQTDASGNQTRVKKFSMDGRSTSFMPYGGGIGLCPGRHFAKQEIMSTVAMLLVNFDIELEGYINMDGSESDRAPKDDPWYCGTAAMPPDRDLKIRWRRR